MFIALASVSLGVARVKETEYGWFSTGSVCASIRQDTDGAATRRRRAIARSCVSRETHADRKTCL